MSVSFPFLQVAFDRFASPELQNVLRRWNINLNGVDLESLQRTLAVIQPIYDEAEVKQFTNRCVKLWLDPIKQLLYDVEDILDGFLTELEILKLKSEHRENHPHQTQQGICERFESNIRDINQKLKSVAEEGARLGLNSSMVYGSSSRPQRPQTSSLVNRSEVFGRDDDKWEIIKWLLSENKTASSSNNDNNFSVQPIVGMGGAGKTTLAQLVYKNESVERHFQLKAWVCVSEDFDELRITKEILESATGSSPSSNSLDTLQKKLKETLNMKRFLLVLDDMWNEDYERWCALRTPFAFGKAGSKILVTTRNKGVASIVRTVPIHYLKALSKDHCSAIFRKHAFMDENSCDANQKWTVFGERIVEKCKGLPLAVKTLAGLLRNKSANCEWKEILENELWYSKETGGILPSLLLSYYHLPPPLKRCFQYCALFPKHYVFNKIDLVVLWMAEGIVQPSSAEEGKQKRVEDIGAAYCDELFMRSLFELSGNAPCSSLLYRDRWSLYSRLYSDDGSCYSKCMTRLPDKDTMSSFFESSNGNLASGYVMHDLIHDLAQFVLGGIFCRTDMHDNKSSEVRTTTRHLSSYMSEPIESETKERLRTIIYFRSCVCTTEFQFQFLRVLLLNHCANSELPDSIGELKQLRFLDLSYSTYLVRLPDSVTSLYNLQTLILFGCDCLDELPEDIGNLVNLRHFSLPGPDYVLPLGVGNLTHLQRLNPFIVGSEHIRVLKDLSQLHGILKITNLENLGNINGTESMVANIKNKPHLVGLHLHWSAYESEADIRFPDLGRDEKVEEDVLHQLHPSTNLQVLVVENYGGTRFPSWMEYPSCFSNLETVELIGCYNCKFLPHLQQLPLLKHLAIRDCNATKMVGSELCGSNSSSSSANKQFRSLVTLTIVGMKEWEEWPEVVEESEEGGGQFPCLQELIIEQCPKLRELSRLLPSLRLLIIEKCPNLSFRPMLPSLKELILFKCKGIAVLNNKMVPRLSSLSSLTIDDVSDLKSLSNGFLQHFTALQELNIHNCGDLMVLLQNEIGFELLPSSLRRLCISQWDNAGKLPQSMRNLHCLQELIIEGAKRLVSLSEELHNLRSLRVLRISACENLESLPRELHTLTSLQEILIERCPALVSFHETKLPAALLNLEIRDCMNLESVPMGLEHNLTSLQSLRLSGCRNLKSLPEGLHKLMSLQSLVLQNCPALESFPDMGLPTNLQKLEIVGCPSLMMDGKNQEPQIYRGIRNLTNLQGLTIIGCPALVSIPKGMLPTNLQQFTIYDCPILESLHAVYDLTSLEKLSIWNCPLLTQRYQKKDGEEWSKISQIPHVFMAYDNHL